MSWRVVKRLLIGLVLVEAPFVWRKVKQDRPRRTENEIARRAVYLP